RAHLWPARRGALPRPHSVDLQLAPANHVVPHRAVGEAATCEAFGMSTFVFRLQAPRPSFALDMTEGEREIMGRHAAYWQPLVDAGRMVVFGPVLDETGSWGLGVVETDDEDEIRAFAAGDPVVTTGTARIKMGKMLAGFVRPRAQ